MRGPQVSALSDDGWLHTGDLGTITDGGDLVIIGRKKEILITSYGKNIHPEKIESLLREIPGLADAMVLGEQLKRWAVLSEHPAIENGEMTGNLKIRRQVVLVRRAAVVEMLYEEIADRDKAAMQRTEVPGVLHVGAMECA